MLKKPRLHDACCLFWQNTSPCPLLIRNLCWWVECGEWDAWGNSDFSRWFISRRICSWLAWCDSFDCWGANICYSRWHWTVCHCCRDCAVCYVCWFSWLLGNLLRDLCYDNLLTRGNSLGNICHCCDLLLQWSSNDTCTWCCSCNSDRGHDWCVVRQLLLLLRNERSLLCLNWCRWCLRLNICVQHIYCRRVSCLKRTTKQVFTLHLPLETSNVSLAKIFAELIDFFKLKQMDSEYLDCFYHLLIKTTTVKTLELHLM